MTITDSLTPFVREGSQRDEGVGPLVRGCPLHFSPERVLFSISNVRNGGYLETSG